MRDKLFFLVWFTLLCGAAAPACADPAPDSDPGFFVAPGPAVPREYAAFAGLWVGTWGKDLDHKLSVMKISPTGEVEAIYAWGDNPQWQIKRGATKAMGRISDGVLELDKFGNGARASYQIKDGILTGKYARGGNTTIGTFSPGHFPGGADDGDLIRFLGNWIDRKWAGPLVVRANTDGVSSISFGATVCAGRKDIPTGELGVVDGRLSVLGDGTFEINVDDPCGRMDVAVKNERQDELELEFYRRRYEDTFTATVSRH